MAVLYFYLNPNGCQTRAEIVAKIRQLKTIVLGLLTAAEKAAITGNHVSYKIDDGQSVQEVVYRSPDALQTSIQSYENLIQYYENKLTGNQYTQVDKANLNRGFNWNNRPF